MRNLPKVDDATEERVHIYGSEYDTLYKPVRSPLDMPNARWEIALAPEELWVDLRRLVILIVFSVLLLLAVTFLAVLVIQQYMNAHKLAELAKIDQLTGLFSRQSAIHAMEKELENASDGSRFGLCFIDMNNFKRINDTFGHTTGDAALKWVANRLKCAVKPEDIVARFGGDEFIIIFSRNCSGDYVTVADNVRKSINGKALLETGVETEISAAVGLSVYPDDGKSVESLVHYADTAMYRNKAVIKDSLN